MRGEENWNRRRRSSRYHIGVNGAGARVSGLHFRGFFGPAGGVLRFGLGVSR